MILVTLGNAKQSFARLAKAADEAFEMVGEKHVVWQLGATPYQAIHGEAFARIERARFAKLISTCEAVICHAGVGTVMEALRAGKKPVVMARRQNLGEHVDDHQLQLVSALASESAIIPVSSAGEIAQALCAIRRGTINSFRPPRTGDAQKFAQAFLDIVNRQKTPHH